MLTEELSASLRERAADIEALPATLLTKIERRTRQHHRRKATSAGVATLVVIAAAGVVGVQLDRSHHSLTAARLTRTGKVPQACATSAEYVPADLRCGKPLPCDTPSRPVQNYLSWSCATGTVTRRNQRQLLSLLQTAKSDLGTPTTHRPHQSFQILDAQHVQMRVLGLGPLPDSTPGSMISAVMFWRRGGHGPAKVELQVSGVGNGAQGSGGPVPAGDPALLASAVAPYSLGTTAPAGPNECHQMAEHPPTPPAQQAVSCTQTILVRPGITAVRLVRGPGQIDAPVPVKDGFAGVNINNMGPRKDWIIQGLNSSGQVVGAVGWNNL